MCRIRGQGMSTPNFGQKKLERLNAGVFDPALYFVPIALIRASSSLAAITLEHRLMRQLRKLCPVPVFIPDSVQAYAGVGCADDMED